MDAQPLTVLDQSASQLHPAHDEPTATSDTHSPISRSWSLKRLLSGRGSRRYRVLEREPNRLRKRASPA
ncbi:hypothetical protein N7492_006091 [Penicillium capsulatum]|uniref:Uncharacterized protein n=1 Tax=Penicillium capsulatum TaxID=69766 RepID=A0A9W9I0T5_9EURO|nr:hypothetical protein N7492_006091 [Penicillium capsulatum]KAJ6108741.1 hypothetical protein N7512_008578 [Penicillium capsulatum]